MTVSPDHARAARLAASRVEQMLVEMLTAHELGSVTIEVTPAGLQPIRRVEDRRKVIKTAQGHCTPIETVTT